MATQATHPHTPRQQQEPNQAALPSHHQANHTPSLASSTSAQPSIIKGLHHIQQRQENSSPEATESGALAQPVQPEGKAQQTMLAAAQQEAQQEAPVSSVDVVLPHNTLVIMWPPMQEAWKHEVLAPLT